ncbi:hypothetical protein [Acinetobacter chengduensis]|uniref:Uncharacterized protein n=1 Tax=Acinetobacter chengduensis TaxID=2420890 RepID=A0ABX9TSX7_9GAMM|nr:hypothetical protein [Acinetobacter chengduensis]RLL19012.1 hypothetical protein D9K81_14750 [Acinetobacter chengduensis]
MKNTQKDLKRYEICLQRPHRPTPEMAESMRALGVGSATEKTTLQSIPMALNELLPYLEKQLKNPENAGYEVLSIVQITEENRYKLSEDSADSINGVIEELR